MHPRTLFILLVSLLIWTAPSFSQSKQIKGQVILHNSKVENGRVKFLSNTKITSITSGHVYSDQKGRFKLKLKKIDTSQPLFLQVEKEGYEVINLRDIKYVLLDKRSWVKIFLAEKGYVKRVRNAMIATTKQALMKEQKKLLQLIETDKYAAIPVFENKFGRKINHIYDADELLSKLSNLIEAEIRYTAYELVIVNPDDASDLYVDAMTHYRQGDFEMAIKTLQKEKVESLMKRLIRDVEKLGDNQLQVTRLLENRIRDVEQIKNNLIFQTIALQQRFRMREAAIAMKNLKKINDVAPTRKHQEIIGRLDFFKVDESLVIDENVLLSENANPSYTPTNNRPQSQYNKNNIPSKYGQRAETNSPQPSYTSSNEKPQFQYNEKNVPSKYGQRAETNPSQPSYTSSNEKPQFQYNEKSVSNKYGEERTVHSNAGFEAPTPVRHTTQSVKNYDSNNYTRQNLTKTENDIGHNLNTTLNKNPEYIEQPNISHSIVNNGSTITVTTTITTNGDSNINVSSDINEAGKVLTQIDSKSKPMSYDHLTAKGGVIKEQKNEKESDFEGIIFPKKNTSSEFKSFLKKEKEETPSNWKESKKFR